MTDMNPTDPVVEEARRAGFDLNLIEMNLSTTPGERWGQHDMALEIILKLEDADGSRCKASGSFSKGSLIQVWSS